MIPFWIIGVFVVAAGLIGFQWNILIGVFVVMGGVVIVMLYIVFAPKYPVQVMIFVKRRGNLRLIKDRASRIETEKGSGTYKYKFKNLKDETKAALYENLYPSGRSGEIALFYSPAPGEFYQATFNEKMKTIKVKKGGKEKEEVIQVPEIVPIPDKLLDWMILKQQRMKQRYLKISAWDRFYPIIVVVVLSLAIAVIINSTFSGLKPVTDAFQATSHELSEAAKIQAETTDRLISIMGELGVDTGDQTLVPVPPPPDVG